MLQMLYFILIYRKFYIINFNFTKLKYLTFSLIHYKLNSLIFLLQKYIIIKYAIFQEYHKLDKE